MNGRPVIAPLRREIANHIAHCERCRATGPLYGHAETRLSGGLTVVASYWALCVTCLLWARERKS